MSNVAEDIETELNKRRAVHIFIDQLPVLEKHNNKKSFFVHK